MIRLRVFSDLHLHPFKAGATLDPETGRNSRLQAGKATLQQILDVGRNRPWQPDLTLFGGDWFHQRGLIPTTALLASVEALQGTSAIVGIAGNHDRTETGESALAGLTGPFFHAADRPVVDVWSTASGPVTLILLPHADDLDAAAAQLAHAVETKVRVQAHTGPTVLLAHNAVDLPGNAVPPGEPAWTLGMLRPVFLAAPDVLLLFGHLHSPRAWRGDVPVPLDNPDEADGRLALQIGSPHQLDWGDAGEARGYWELEWNPQSSPIWTARFCPTSAPRFVDLRETPDAQVWRQDFVRAAAPAPEDPPCANWEHIPDAKVDEQKKDRADLSANLSDEEILARYLDYKAPDLDRDAALRLGRDLLAGGGTP